MGSWEKIVGFLMISNCLMYLYVKAQNIVINETEEV